MPPSLLVLLLILTAAPVRAQVNVEKMRAVDVNGVALSFNGSMALLSGNSDVFNLGLGSRLDVRQGRHYSFLVGHVAYGESGDVKNRQRAFGHLRYNYDFTPWLVGEVFTQVEHDAFTRLQLRVLGGTGGRIRYLRGERLRLLQGTSVMYEFEDLDAAKAGDHPATVYVWRWSNYVHLRLALTDQTYFINTVYVQPRFDAFGDVRVLDEATLAIALTRHLTFTTGFNLRYDSRPPGTVDSLDLALQNGLTVEF